MVKIYYSINSARPFLPKDAPTRAKRGTGSNPKAKAKAKARALRARPARVKQEQNSPAPKGGSKSSKKRVR